MSTTMIKVEGMHCDTWRRLSRAIEREIVINMPFLTSPGGSR